MQQNGIGKYLLYSFLFSLTFLFFFLVPEWMTFQKFGWFPAGDLTAPNSTYANLGEAVNKAWQDGKFFSNPLENSLIRFFLVATVVGFFYQKMRFYSKSH